MTKKDFIAIAGAISESREWAIKYDVSDPDSVLDVLAGKLAIVLKARNPRFKSDTFLAACGVK